MSYLKSAVIRSAQGVDVQETAHLNVPSIAGITIVGTHPHYINAFKASVDPDALLLNDAQAAAALVEVVEAAIAHVDTHKTDLNAANKATKTALDECGRIVDQDVSSSTDLRGDADLVAQAKRDAAEVAGRRLDTACDVYAGARAIAGRIDTDDLATLATPGLRKAVQDFEKMLSAADNAQSRARQNVEAFAEIERRLADPAREGAARDLRAAMHSRATVDALGVQLDAVRGQLRDQLDQLDAISGQVATLRQWVQS